MRMLDLGQEAVVLSGLSKHAASSLKNIKNLYDETKYLKSYLEKVNRFSDSNIFDFITQYYQLSFIVLKC